MKIAVIADVHANFVALQTVIEHVDRWRPDYVIVLGDLVNRGPRPAECLQLILDRVQSRGWLTVRGNHEEYVMQHDLPDAPRTGPAFEVHRASFWTYNRLDRRTGPLRDMPFCRRVLAPDGREAAFYHGSTLGLRDGIYPETTDSELLDKVGLNSRHSEEPVLSLFCAGHTHRPFVRFVDGLLIVNAGSAGLPFDLDTRAAYAQLCFTQNRWQAEIVRLSYDLDAAAADFERCGYLLDGGPLVTLVLRELLTARSHLYTWAVNYQEMALRGHIGMEESVRRHLNSYGE